MLNFLRKYQRIVFIIVTGFVVISFAFFGTQDSSFGIGQKSADRIVSHDVDGNPIYESRLSRMQYLFSSDHHGVKPLFVDVLERDFLETKILSILAEKHFDEVGPQIAERVAKAKGYRPYVHPTAPFLNTQVIWNNFAPQVASDLALLKDLPKEPSLEAVDLLSDLYVGQTSFSGDVLKRILMYQQQYYSWVDPDPQLPGQDLCLFHFHTPQDWFGPKLVDLVCGFVINGAVIAEQKGYKVTDEEVRAEILRNIIERMQGTEVNYKDALAIYKQQLSILHIDEKELISSWRDILLFRRLFDDVGEGALIDSYAYEKFYEYAGEGVQFKEMHLPHHLCFSNFWDVLKLQFYIQAVSSETHPLHLPMEYISAKEVAKQFPELVQKRFSVEYAYVNIDDLAKYISLKELWDWQLDENNYKELEEQFPQLEIEHSDRSKRFAKLEKIDHELRRKVDHYAQKQIVAKHPEWIEEALKEAPLRKEVLNVNLKDKNIHFPGIQKVNSFLSLLKQAPLEGEELTEEKITAHNILSCYSNDGEHFYSFRLLERTQGKEIVPFAEAIASPFLDQLLTARLEDAYVYIREKHPQIFLDENGEYKPFDEVKEDVGFIFYSNMVGEIEHDFGESKSSLADRKAFATSHRLYHYCKEVKRALENDPNDEQYIESVRLPSDTFIHDQLTNQWRLIATDRKITRSSPEFCNRDYLFAAEDGSFTPIQSLEGGDLSFVQMNKHFTDTEKIEEKVKEGQRNISKEAKRKLARDLDV